MALLSSVAQANGRSVLSHFRKYSHCTQRLQIAGPGNDSAPRERSGSERVQEAGARNAATKVDNAGADAKSGMAVEKAIATASAVGSWVLENGERQGKLLLRRGRDWLDGRNRAEEEIRSGESEGNNSKIERRATRVVVSEEPRQEERPAGKAPDLVRTSTGSDAGKGSSSAGNSNSKGSAEGAWRRGRLDNNDKQS